MNAGPQARYHERVGVCVLVSLHLVQFAAGGRVSGADPDCKEQGYLDGGGV